MLKPKINAARDGEDSPERSWSERDPEVDQGHNLTEFVSLYHFYGLILNV